MEVEFSFNLILAYLSIFHPKLHNSAYIFFHHTQLEMYLFDGPD